MNSSPSAGKGTVTEGVRRRSRDRVGSQLAPPPLRRGQATGYRPHLDYLSLLCALDDGAMPRHAGRIAATYRGLVYVGLEFQRSFSSNTLRGWHRDAEHVVTSLAAHVRNAPAALGF